MPRRQGEGPRVDSPGMELPIRYVMATLSDSLHHAGDREGRTFEANEDQDHHEAKGAGLLQEPELGADPVGEHRLRAERGASFHERSAKSLGGGERMTVDLIL